MSAASLRNNIGTNAMCNVVMFGYLSLWFCHCTQFTTCGDVLVDADIPMPISANTFSDGRNTDLVALAWTIIFSHQMTAVINQAVED